MMLRHFTLLGALSVAIAAVVACGGSGSSTGSTSQAVSTNFDGVYVPKTAGAIGSIAFTHGRDYLLMPTGCQSQGCSEIGTYSIDDAKSVVVLTSTSGTSRSLSLKVLATEQKEATIAKTQSAGITMTVRDLINTDSGSLVGASDAGSLVALIQALINAITQAQIGNQDMSQLGGDDAGGAGDISIPDFDFSIPDSGVFTYPCSDAGAGSDSGADAGICTFSDCTTNLPTSTSTVAEIDVYFAICPYGPTTYYYAH